MNFVRFGSRRCVSIGFLRSPNLTQIKRNLTDISTALEMVSPMHNVPGLSYFTTKLYTLMGSAPTTIVVEHLMQWAHEPLGLQWGASVMLVTFGVRSLCSILDIYAQRKSRQNLVLKEVNLRFMPIITAKVIEKINAEPNPDRLTEREVKRRVRQKQIEYTSIIADKFNTSSAQPFKFGYLMIPIWLSVTFAVNNFCMPSEIFLLQNFRDLSTIDYATSSFLWLPCLSKTDPHYILPAAIATVSILHFQLKRANLKPMQDKYMRMFNKKSKLMYIPLGVHAFGTVFVIGLSWIMPSGLALSWFTWNATAFLIHFALDFPSVKNFLKITPLEEFDTDKPIEKERTNGFLIMDSDEQTAIPSIYLIGLSSKSIHTVYAGSFVVYTANCVADWLHTIYATRGWTITFALKDWAAYSMIGCSFVGSVLTFLLIHLCCENALWRRWQIEEYDQGCRVICQRFCYWFTDFDCFRISFLIMLFQDAPMTMINFWFLNSCSIAQPDKQVWPFYFSCSTTLLSLIWRSLLLFLYYRRVRFIDYENRQQLGQQQRNSSKYKLVAGTVDQEGNGVPSAGAQYAHTTDDYAQPDSTLLTIKNAAGYGNRGRRLSQYDECWSVRTSLWLTFNSDRYQPAVYRREKSRVACLCRALFCCLTCHILCVVCGLLACTPCCQYYCCRKNASLNRQRFSKTCTKYSAKIFHLSLISVSVFLLISSAVLNILWMSSVHLLGNDRAAPEINQICLTRMKPTPWIFVQKYTDTSETLAVWTDSRVPVHAARDGGGDTIHIYFDLAYKNGHICRDYKDFRNRYLLHNYYFYADGVGKPLKNAEERHQLTVDWTTNELTAFYLTDRNTNADPR
uniref:Uncharacterized protein n=1 Tax=Romanomermis culicivorax TaxID=13658 RepID=A0A915KL06_ROMCU